MTFQRGSKFGPTTRLTVSYFDPFQPIPTQPNPFLPKLIFRNPIGTSNPDFLLPTMSDVTPSENLVNALLDGQLDAQQSARATEAIAADPQLSKLLAELTDQRNQFSELPSHRLSDKFADRVLEIAALDLEVPVFVNVSPSSTVDWKKYAMSLAAIAALLMAMLVYQWTPGNSNGDAIVARREADTSSARSLAVESTDNVDTAHQRDEQFNDQANMDSFGLADNATPKATEPDLVAAPVAAPQADTPSTFGFSSGSGQPGGDSQGQALNDSKPTLAKNRSDAVDPQDYATGGKAISGTAMAFSAPAEMERQQMARPSPAIDQVWILEVDRQFNQQQLLDSFAANSIAIPPDLQQASLAPSAATAKSNSAKSNSAKSTTAESNLTDDDGIYVMANASQMKQALQQLSQSGTVSISGYQLPDQSADKRRLLTQDLAIADDEVSVEPESEATAIASAPTTLPPPPRAMAQRLRGNRFQSYSSPSSKVPQSFAELEEMMGAPYRATPDKITLADAAGRSRKTTVAESDAEALEETGDFAAGPDSGNRSDPMAELFPKSQIESKEMQNFLILIRDLTATEK